MLNASEMERNLKPQEILGLMPEHLAQPFQSPGYMKMYPGEREEGLMQIISDQLPQKAQYAGEYIYGKTRKPTENEKAYDERLIDLYSEVPSRSRPEAQRKFMEANGVYDDLMSEYKIHFQVKTEYIPYFLNKLMWIIKNDMAIAKVVRIFKLQSELPMDNFPGVVIYLRPDKPTIAEAMEVTGNQNIHGLVKERLAESRKSMVAALARFDFYFKDDVAIIGANKPPRCNSKINNLTYVAQAGGDIKCSLAKEVLDEFFDPEQSWSFRRGEEAPTQEELEKVDCSPDSI